MIEFIVNIVYNILSLMLIVGVVVYFIYFIRGLVSGKFRKRFFGAPIERKLGEIILPPISNQKTTVSNFKLGGEKSEKAIGIEIKIVSFLAFNVRYISLSKEGDRELIAQLQDGVSELKKQYDKLGLFLVSFLILRE